MNPLVAAPHFRESAVRGILQGAKRGTGRRWLGTSSHHQPDALLAVVGAGCGGGGGGGRTRLIAVITAGAVPVGARKPRLSVARKRESLQHTAACESSPRSLPSTPPFHSRLRKPLVFVSVAVNALRERRSGRTVSNVVSDARSRA
ncbi:hypothetical protein E2C01_018960 [Portunus trituberculatus]|uniref:Uncharacterized protein n=1 Tax=Portunus trituberculatus TaxID=210409 RepID=A0A5B7DXR8_PORTR|nr:hypothetical protein [Portunus trituberculatus]